MQYEKLDDTHIGKWCRHKVVIQTTGPRHSGTLTNIVYKADGEPLHLILDGHMLIPWRSIADFRVLQKPEKP